MKIFISWSGSRSEAIAKALRGWLPNVIQAIKPWFSSEIEKGSRWSAAIAKELEQTKFGIICLTPENLDEPWIHFEAGALSKTLKDTFVCPYLLGLVPTDMSGPLVQFQAATADKKDTLELIKSINMAVPDSLPEDTLETTFEKWWPDLEDNIEKIMKDSGKIVMKKRSEREILEEILEHVRGLSRSMPKKLALEDLFPGIRIQRHCSKCGSELSPKGDGKTYVCPKCDLKPDSPSA